MEKNLALAGKASALRELFNGKTGALVVILPVVVLVVLPFILWQPWQVREFVITALPILMFATLAILLFSGRKT